MWIILHDSFFSIVDKAENRVLHDAYLGVWSDLRDVDDRYASH